MLMIEKILAELMRKRGYDQVLLSKISGVPRTTITRILSGRANPTLKTLAKISAAFGITVSELRGEAPVETKPESPIEIKFRELIYSLSPDDPLLDTLEALIDHELRKAKKRK